MRKTLLFTTILLLCAGAIQAQVTRYEMATVPEESARKGGLKEAGGTVFISSTTSGTGNFPSDTTESITFHFSAPLAEGSSTVDSPESPGFAGFLGTTATAVVTEKDTADNDGNGTIKVTGLVDQQSEATIRDLVFDVSEASAPITVKITATAKDPAQDSDDVFITLSTGPTTANVITDIVLGVKAEAKSKTVRTRGTGAAGVEATLTIEEAFKGAFMHDNTLELEISGLPEGVKVGAMSDQISVNETAAAAEEAEETPEDAVSTATGNASCRLGDGRRGRRR